MDNLNENWFLELTGFPQVAKNGQISLEFAVKWDYNLKNSICMTFIKSSEKNITETTKTFKNILLHGQTEKYIHNYHA